MSRAFRIVVPLLLAVTALTACTNEPPPLHRLVIAGGPPSDIYAAFAAGIADAASERWSINANVLTTAGSKENLQLVADGTADVGFATIDAAQQAIDGEAPFSGSVPIVALAGLYDDYLHVVVLADSGIHTFSDLRGHRLGTSGSGVAAKILTDRLIASGEVNKVTTVTVVPAAVADALIDRRVDAIALTGGLPTPAVDQLRRRMPIRLIPIVTERAPLFQSFPDQYLSRSLPAGMYGLASEVETVGVRSVLVVRRDLPDAIAYSITELLFSARSRLVAAHDEAKRLDPRSALDTYPLALHAGAARYYRDTKPLV